MYSHLSSPDIMNSFESLFLCFQATLLILKTFDWWFKQSQIAIIFTTDLWVICKSEDITAHRGLIFFERSLRIIDWMMCSGLVSSLDAINPNVLSWNIQIFLIMCSVCISLDIVHL